MTTLGYELSQTMSDIGQMFNVSVSFFKMLFFYTIPLFLIMVMIVIIFKKFGVLKPIKYTAPRWAVSSIRFLNMVIYIFIVMLIVMIYDLMTGNISLMSFIDTLFFSLLPTTIYYFILRSMFVVILGTDGHDYGVPDDMKEEA